jgi:hypothetical protein
VDVTVGRAGVFVDVWVLVNVAVGGTGVRVAVFVGVVDAVFVRVLVGIIVRVLVAVAGDWQVGPAAP